MYSDEIQRLIDRSSMLMFISVIAALLSVITVIIAADFLSNELPPSIAVKYFQVLTFLAKCRYWSYSRIIDNGSDWRLHDIYGEVKPK